MYFPWFDHLAKVIARKRCYIKDMEVTSKIHELLNLLSVLCWVKCSARLLYLIHGAFGFHLPYLWMIRKINVFIFHSYMSFVLLTQHACIPFHFSFIMSVFPFVICHVASFFQTWALLFESSGRMNYSFVPAVSLPRSACDCGVQHLSWNISLCSE